MIARFVVTASLLLTGSLSAQDYRVVFEGRPVAKVEANFEEVQRTELRADKAFEYAVRIVQRQGRYYWASREMKRLIRHEAGAYITYVAIDGTGYVRTFIPMMLAMRDQLSLEQQSREIGYTEHLLTQFASITYFGNRLGAR